MNALTDVVRGLRARPIIFELPDDPPELVEIDPPSMAQVMACVRLDPKPGQPETAAVGIVRTTRQAAILLGSKNARLLDLLQPRQLAEVVVALYAAACGLPVDVYVRWHQQRRQAGDVTTSQELLENMEALSIELSARLSKMPSEVETMPSADAVALRDRISALDKAKAELQATIAGVKLDWRRSEHHV